MTDAMGPPGGAASRILKRAFSSALKAFWLLLRITVPVSFAVAALDWFGAIKALAAFLDPVMVFVGLPGEASLALISSLAVNVYSVIAVIGAVGLSGRALAILSIMCLVCHNLPVETAIMKKTGSSALKMVFLRVAMMIGVGFFFNLVLPYSAQEAQARDARARAREAALAAKEDSGESIEAPELIEPGDAAPGTASGFSARVLSYWKARPPVLPALGRWARDTGFLLLKMILLVSLVMILQKVLDEFGFMGALARALSPLLKLFGLPAGTSALWLVIQVAGYAYGAAVLVDQVAEGKLPQRDGDLLNHHAAACHSMLEDTVLFASIGAPVLIITLPRIVLAAIVVWLERARRYLLKKSFSVGTV
jgi:spore maturation protein SpmB